MVGISQVLQTLGAMVIFSLILLTTNRIIQMNTLHEVGTEAEGIAVTIAQGVIEEAQTKAFDATTVDGSIPTLVPQDFSSCGPSSSEAGNREKFNDFDDYDGYSAPVDTKFGKNSFKIEKVEVSYVSPPDFKMATGSKSTPTYFKKMRVTVSSDYLKNANNQIKLTYLRRYYKTKNP